MGSALPIGRLFGINIRIDTTLLLLFVLFGYQGYSSGGVHGAADELTFLVFIFLSIFFHEMGHAGAAAAFGIRTEDVTLHFFGGYARFSEPPRRPLDEAVIAIAGPIVNLSIALGLFGLLQAHGQADGEGLLAPYRLMLGKLLYANVLLGVFNLLPGFPLDGGSFVRAILSLWLSRASARAIVAYIGIAVGLGLAAMGWFVLGGNTMTIVLGFLLALLAYGEAGAARRAMNA